MIFKITRLLAPIVLILFYTSISSAKETIGNHLKGHIYELKSIGFGGKACDKYIDILVNADQKTLTLNKFKFKVGSGWGEVSNDSKDEIPIDSVKIGQGSNIVLVAYEAQDSDEIKVTIELSGYDQAKEQFTKSLVNITGETTSGCDGELILSLKNLHMHVSKIR